MGTGVLSNIFSALENNGIAPDLTLLAAQTFLVLAIIVAIPVVGITTVRWLKFPEVVKKELTNPVKGAMAVTYAGSFLVLAVAFGRSGMSLFGVDVATTLTYVFTAIGGILALAIGMAFLTDIFVREGVQPAMISGAWFIPPVVTIVVPTALAPLLLAPSTLANELLWLSWVILGVGALLYFVIVAALFYRTATGSLPPAHLAPTLAIGMGPAGLIGLDLVLLAHASQRVQEPMPSLLEFAAVAGAMLWGFGLWWGVASIIVIWRGYRIPAFGISWWGFTFPLGVWVAGGITIGFEVGSMLIVWLSLVGAALLLVIWLVNVVRTLVGIKNKTIWAG